MIRVIKKILCLDGYDVVTMNEYDEQVAKQLYLYDLIILDIMMSQIDGYEIMRELRDETTVPIIYLTAKVQEADVLKGFGLGADDYIKKPFSPDELRARVRVHLQREQRVQKTVITKGKFRFDVKAKRLFYGNTQINLTKGEYQICEYLAQYAGQVFSKEQIFEEVFGFDKESNENTITTHIKNIRSKLAEFDDQPIHTIWGIGYKWEIKK